MIDNELKQVLIHDSRDDDDTSESKDDDRSEMPWTSKQEAYILRIKNECLELQNEHSITKAQTQLTISYSIIS